MGVRDGGKIMWPCSAVAKSGPPWACWRGGAGDQPGAIVLITTAEARASAGVPRYKTRGSCRRSGQAGETGNGPVPIAQKTIPRT